MLQGDRVMKRALAAVVITVVILLAKPTVAAWVIKPPDGYGCPPGYNIKVIRINEEVIDICMLEAKNALLTKEPEDQNSTDENNEEVDTTETRRM